MMNNLDKKGTEIKNAEMRGVFENEKKNSLNNSAFEIL